MCAVLQLVSAPLNLIPTAEHFRRSHPQREHSYGQHIYMSKENNISYQASFLSQVLPSHVIKLLNLP